MHTYLVNCSLNVDTKKMSVTIEQASLFFDTEGSGHVPIGVVHEILAAAGTSPAATEVKSLLEKRENAESNKVSIAYINEMYNIFKLETNLKAEQYHKLFSLLDPSKQGQVDFACLEYLLQYYEEKFDKGKAEKLCAYIGDISSAPTRSAPIQTVVEKVMQLYF